MVERVSDESEPAVRQHDRVELVAVKNHQTAPVRRVVKGRPGNFHPAEIHAGEGPNHLVMIAGDVDDPRAAVRALEDAPDDVVVFGRPVELLLQPPSVDDIADEVQCLAVRMVEEVDQQFGIAALGAEVDVADPDGAELAPLVEAGALGHLGPHGQEAGNIGECGKIGRQFGHVRPPGFEKLHASAM